MKIIYYAKHNRKGSDATENHLAAAITALGHEVVRVNPWEDMPEGDLVLFHKDLPPGTTPAICWYFDKIGFNHIRVRFMEKALERADLVFVTDGTWADQHPNQKFRVLRQGIGDPTLGEKIDVTAKVAFTGTLYGERFEFCGALAKRYKDDFQIFNGVNNKDFNDLCATVPIFVAPQHPSDDNYWSNRVYLTIGSGGFLIHPRLKELEKEYIDEKEIVYYDSMDDLKEKIDYFLEHEDEREAIRLAGWEKTKKLYTYQARVEQLLKEYEAYRQ